MFDAATKYISNVYIVNKFLKDASIRGKQATIENAYKKIIKGQSINTNIPDNDVPAKARIVFNDNKKQLLVSQESAQLTLRFDSGLSLTNQFDTIKKYIDLMMVGTSEFIDKANFLETGLVTIINYPSKETTQKINSYIFDNFLKANPFGEIETASCKIGFKTDDLYINIELDGYEVREGVTKPSGDNLFIKVEDLPLKEVGLQVKLDINNRPQTTKTIPDSGILIVNRLESLVTTELDNYLSVGFKL